MVRFMQIMSERDLDHGLQSCVLIFNLDVDISKHPLTLTRLRPTFGYGPQLVSNLALGLVTL